MKIKVPTVENIIQTNKYVCNEKGQVSQLLDRGKIESALSTAFYPGSEPFENGGVARLAGALCFYLTKQTALRPNTPTSIDVFKKRKTKQVSPIKFASMT